MEGVYTFLIALFFMVVSPDRGQDSQSANQSDNPVALTSESLAIASPPAIPTPALLPSLILMGSKLWSKRQAQTTSNETSN